jgi:3-oxoacyl-[acyl-carrier protein] reductase
MADKEFEGRVALVTGGSRGIGRAICVRLAEAGAKVAINYAENTDAARETREMVRAAGAEGRIYKADVSELDQTEAMYDEIEKDLGPVDLLVTNAGIASFQDDADMSAEVWNKILKVNINGTFNPVWRAKGGMLERGYGRIVCIASINGLASTRIRRGRLIAYGTSKSAVIGFARNCADAFGPKIRVNCVAPGLIETDMTKDMTDEVRDKIYAMTPLGRAGQPTEIAELAHFLLSEKSSFTTGQTYVASGGMVNLP